MYRPTKSGNPQFYIRSGDVGFADRQKSIFDQLAAVEKVKAAQTETVPAFSEPEQMTMDIEPVNRRPDVRSLKRNRSEMKQFRGKESIFKRPDALPPRFKAKSIPDYHKNPHKWVKYSLGDVSQDDMSDRSNSAAAFSFLQEVAARKASLNSEDMEVDQANSKVAFRRPKVKSQITLGSVVVKSETEATTAKVKPSFRSSKLVMPEYVVGQKSKKMRKKAELISTSDEVSEKGKEVQLGHLIAEEEDE